MPRKRYYRRRSRSRWQRPSIISLLLKALDPFPDNAIRDYSLYAIKQKGGKYYVGMTSYKDVGRRTGQHGGQMGARWTAKYLPEEVVEVRRLGKMSRLAAENLENDMTLEYMKQYGKQNVRGGRMVSTSRLLLKTHNIGSVRGFLQIILIALAIFGLVVSCFVFVTS